MRSSQVGGSLNDLFLGRSALTGNPYPRQLIPAPPVPESSVALNVGGGETSSGICLVVTLGGVGPAATAFMPQAADELSLNYLSSQVIRIPASTSSNESLAPPRRDVATLRLGTILPSMSHYSPASLGPLGRPPSSEAILIFQRSRDRLGIVCPVMFSGALFIGEGLIHNLSQTGCLVECDRRMLEGSYMAVRLLLPDTTHALIIELAAVRWIREEYFGIEFLKLPTSDQARLAHFLLAHQR